MKQITPKALTSILVKPKLQSFVIGALLLSAISVALSCTDSKEKQVSSQAVESSDAGQLQKAGEERDSSPEIPSPVVVTKVTKSGAIARHGIRTFTAVTSGIRDAKIDAKRPGRIVAIDVALGDAVVSGQTLIRLDSVLESLAVDAAIAGKESAEAGREKAKRDLKRAGELFAESGISESRLENIRLAFQIADATYNGAVAELGVARRQLSETQIVAPFTGEVAQLPYEIGETPLPGGIVAEVTDRRKLIAEIFLSEEEAQLISTGMVSSVSVAGDSLGARDGIVRALSPKGNEVTKLFKGEVVIDNSDLFLRAGVTCRVTFLAGGADSPVIPLDAIVESEGQVGGSLVVVAVKSSDSESGFRASLRRVTLGKRIGAGVSIVSGLNFGERIVVKGAQSLSDNQPLRALKEVSLDSLLH